jgi:hypothetical protein
MKCGGDGMTVYQGRWHMCPACRGTGSCADKPEANRTEQPRHWAKARRTDPSTSTDAAKAMSGHVLTALQRDVLAAVLDLHDRLCRGANASEVQVWLNEHGRFVETNSVGSRFNELREALLLRQDGERPGLSGRSQQVFFPTDAGREWMRDRSAA